MAPVLDVAGMSGEDWYRQTRVLYVPFSVLLVGLVLTMYRSGGTRVSLALRSMRCHSWMFHCSGAVTPDDRGFPEMSVGNGRNLSTQGSAGIPADSGGSIDQYRAPDVHSRLRKSWVVREPESWALVELSPNRPGGDPMPSFLQRSPRPIALLTGSSAVQLV